MRFSLAAIAALAGLQLLAASICRGDMYRGIQAGPGLWTAAIAFAAVLLVNRLPRFGSDRTTTPLSQAQTWLRSLLSSVPLFAWNMGWFDGVLEWLGLDLLSLVVRSTPALLFGLLLRGWCQAPQWRAPLLVLAIDLATTRAPQLGPSPGFSAWVLDCPKADIWVTLLREAPCHIMAAYAGWIIAERTFAPRVAHAQAASASTDLPDWALRTQPMAPMTEDLHSPEPVDAARGDSMIGRMPRPGAIMLALGIAVVAGLLVLAGLRFHAWKMQRAAFQEQVLRLSGTAPAVARLAGQAAPAAPSALPPPAPGLDAARLAAGSGYALALTANGRLLGWGTNTAQVIGGSSAELVREPVHVNFDTAKAIAAGDYFSLAVKTGDGSVWQWGDAGGGPRGDIPLLTPLPEQPAQVRGLQDVVAVAATHYAVALRSDGTVWTWGRGGLPGNGSPQTSREPVQASGLSGVIAIGASEAMTVALKGDGTVWCWGRNRHGMLGLNSQDEYQVALAPAMVPGLGGVRAIAVNDLQVLALKEDGTVWAWGSGIPVRGGENIQPAPVEVTTLGRVTAIFAHYDEAAAIKFDQSLWTWGNAEYSRWQLGQRLRAKFEPVPAAGLDGAVTVAIGTTDSFFVLKRDGQVQAWGDSYGSSKCPCPGVYTVVDPDGKGILKLSSP